MSLDLALTIARSGLASIQRNLAQTAQNIANAETPGYTRKTVPQQALVARRHAARPAQHRCAARGGYRGAGPARPEPRRGRRRDGAGSPAAGHRAGAWRRRRWRDAGRCGRGAGRCLHPAARRAGRCRPAACGAGRRDHGDHPAQRCLEGDRHRPAAGAGRHRGGSRLGQCGAARHRRAHHPDQVRPGRRHCRAGGPARPGDQQPRRKPGGPGDPQAERRPAADRPRRRRCCRSTPAGTCCGTAQATAGPETYHGAGGSLPGDQPERQRHHRPDHRRPARRIHRAAGPRPCRATRRRPTWWRPTWRTASPARAWRCSPMRMARTVPDPSQPYAGSAQVGLAGRLRVGLAVVGTPRLLRDGTQSVAGQRGRAGCLHPQSAGWPGRLHRPARPGADLQPRRRRRRPGSPWAPIAGAGLGPDGTPAARPSPRPRPSSGYADSVTVAQLGDRAAATAARTGRTGCRPRSRPASPPAPASTWMPRWPAW